MQVFLFLLIAVAFLLLTFSMHLFCTKNGSRMMNYFLGFSLLARFFQILVFLLLITSFTVLFPIVQEFYILLYFSSLVSSYLYIRCFIYGEDLLKRIDLIHIIPIVFAIIHIIPYSLFAEINWDLIAIQIISGGQFSITERTGLFSAHVYNTMQILFSIGYLLASWYVVFNSKFFYRAKSSSKNWILYFVGMSSFFKVLGFVALIFGTVEKSYTNSVLFLFICCIVLFFMMIFVIYQPHILYGYIVLSENYTVQTSKIITSENVFSKKNQLEKLNYKNDYLEFKQIFLQKSLNEETSKELEIQMKIYQKTLDLLENEKVYTNPNLSITHFSEKVGSNEKYVSSAISAFAKVNYSQFINSYRVNEAKRLIYENELLSLNEIMTASGFNSRTTFYTAFNKYTGMSPNQFKDMSTLSPHS